jgi:uncharacterized protein YukE
VLQTPSVLITCLTAGTVACVVLAATSEPQAPPQGVSELPSAIRDAEAAYEKRQIEIDDAISDAGWLNAGEGPEARRLGMERWIDEHRQSFIEQSDAAEQIDRLYDRHGLTDGIESPAVDSAFASQSSDWADTAEGRAKSLDTSLDTLRQEYRGQSPEVFRDALERWIAANSEAFEGLRHQQETEEEQRNSALDADPALAQSLLGRTVELGNTSPDAPAEQKRIAEIQKEQAQIRDEILAAEALSDPAEVAVRCRSAMKTAFEAQAAELQVLQESLSKSIEQAAIRKAHENNPR